MHFVTFADTRFAPTLDRITYEAKRVQCFHSIRPHSERDLAPEVLAKHRDFIRRRRGGFGRYIWKPQVVLQVMDELPEEAVVVYADAGCVLNLEGEPRLREYAEMVGPGTSGLLGFSLSQPERNWTKRDVLEFYSFIDEDDLSSPQVMGGVFVLANRPDTRDMVRRWRHGCEQYRLLDDSPSYAPNDPGFVRHRHDQSHFSILFKQHGGLTLPDETYWEGCWEDRREYPIHTRRLKKKRPTAIFCDLLRLSLPLKPAAPPS